MIGAVILQFVLIFLNAVFASAEMAVVTVSETKLEKLALKLDALSPLKIMSRGYLFARNETGKIIKTINDLNIDDVLELKLCDGSAKCTINDIVRGE